jgi:hypothetical protein
LKGEKVRGIIGDNYESETDAEIEYYVDERGFT